MEFENTTRGDLALVVSQWGDTRNPKVGPNQIIARVKSVNAVERALQFFSRPELRIQINMPLVDLAPVFHGALNADFKSRNNHL